MPSGWYTLCDVTIRLFYSCIITKVTLISFHGGSLTRDCVHRPATFLHVALLHFNMIAVYIFLSCSVHPLANTLGTIKVCRIYYIVATKEIIVMATSARARCLQRDIIGRECQNQYYLSDFWNILLGCFLIRHLA